MSEHGEIKVKLKLMIGSRGYARSGKRKASAQGQTYV